MSLMKRIFAEKRVALVVVGALVGANVLVYGLGVYPQRARVIAAEQRAQVAARDAVNGEATLTAVRTQLEDKTRADGELRQFYDRVLPRDLAGARGITYPRLAALADEMGLVLERRTSDRDQDEESELGRLRTTLSLAGAYGNIRRFIEALETAPEFLVIEEVVLSQREDVGEASLVLTLAISTYYRLGEGV